MVGRAVQRRHHMTELVKHRQIFEHWVAAHIIQIAQKRRAGHRNKDTMTPTKLNVVLGISGVIGKL